MLSKSYLHGLDASPLEDYPGVFAARDYRDPNSSRLIASYADGKRHKARIFTLLKGLGQSEVPGMWDLHHVVEGQHVADIDFTGTLPDRYRNDLPCVLLHKDEHVAYNQLLHTKATDELFRDRLPPDMLERSKRAAAEANDPTRHLGLRLRVQGLKRLYRDTYEGDPVLQKIAENVLNQALLQLGAAGRSRMP